MKKKKLLLSPQKTITELKHIVHPQERSDSERHVCLNTCIRTDFIHNNCNRGTGDRVRGEENSVQNSAISVESWAKQTNSGVPDHFKPKAREMRGWPIAGFLACDVYLLLVCNWVWHKLPDFGKNKNKKLCPPRRGDSYPPTRAGSVSERIQTIELTITGDHS